MKVWTDLRAVHTEEWKTLFERLISQSVYSVIILDIGNGVEDVFQLLRLCDQILMPCAEGCICDGKNCAVPAYVEGTAVSGAGVAYHVYQYGGKYASGQ